MRGFRVSGLFRACRILVSLTLVLTIPLSGVSVAFAEDVVQPTPLASAESSPTVVREDTARRTANSKHFLLSDGSYQAKIFPGSVHYQDAAGAWKDINPALVPSLDPGEYRTAAGQARMSTGPQTLSERPVRLESDGWAVELDMLGVAENAKYVVGNQARYLSVARDTDLVYESTGDGLKETLVLDSPAAPRHFSFFMSLEGLQLRQTAPGAWALFEPKSLEPVLHVGGLEVFDSGIDERTGMPARCPDATMSITPVAGGAYVTYDVPAEWLEDPAREFPVYVDPTITSSVATYVYQYTPGTSYGSSTVLNAGKQTNGQEWAFAYWNLTDAGLPANANILNADASLWLIYAYTGATEKLGKITSSWGETTTWNTRPSVSYLTSQYVSGSNKWVTWDVDDTVRDWFYGRATNFGLSVYQYDVVSRHQFASDDEAYAAHRPTLTIAYEVPTASVSDYTQTYRVGDTVTARMRVSTASPTRVREARILPNYAGGVSSRYRGYMGWFSYAPDSSWTKVACPSGGYFAYWAGSTFGTDKIVPLTDQWSVTAGSGYVDYVFKWTIDDDYGDIQDNDLDTYFQMGTATVMDKYYGWTNQNTNIDILPKPVTDLNSETNASGWFTEVDRDGDGVSDTPNDQPDVGRGAVELGWSASPLADGYRVYAFDGGSYQQVGETFGNAATSWSTEDAGIYPTDSQIAEWGSNAYSGNPFSATSPLSSATSLGSFARSDSSCVVVSDGTYLYARPYDADKTTDRWTRIGSGFGGTTLGQAAGLVGPALTDQPIRSAFYHDGFLYGGYATAANAIQGTWTGASTDSENATLAFSDQLIRRSNASELSGASADVLVAADDEHVYSIGAYKDGADYYKIRVFEHDGTFLADHVVAAFCDDAPLAATSDGERLYIVEDDAARSVVTYRLSDFTVLRRSATALVTEDCSISFDPANRVLWAGAVQSGGTSSVIGSYAGPGLDLRDDPEALYEATDGTTYDDHTNYAFRVVPYSEIGALELDANNYTAPTLDVRTARVNDDPRHTVWDLGEMAHHAGQVTLDTGTLALDTTDLSIASWGPPATVSRYYSSETTAASSFAPGWRFGFEQSIEASGSVADYIDSAGETHRFTQIDGVWHSPNGYYATLEVTSGEYTLTFKDRSYLLFDEEGELTCEGDRNGNEVTYTRDDGDLTITAANGQSIVVVIEDGKALWATLATPDGTREVGYETDTIAATATVTYWEGTDYEYGVEYGYADERLAGLRVLDDAGDLALFAGAAAEWDFTYGSGRLAAVGFPQHAESTTSSASIGYTVGTSSEGTATVTRTGAVVEGEAASVLQTYTWNPTGTMRGYCSPRISSETPQWWSYEYAPGNEVRCELSPTGATITRTIDSRGNTLYDFDEAGHRNAWRYDAYDQVVAHTDPRGAATYYTYDAEGNLKSEEAVLNAAGERSVALYSYNDSGTVEQEQRKLNANEWATTCYEDFAACGEAQSTHQDGVRLSLGAEPVTLTTTREFDAFGNTLSETDALGVTTAQSDYGALGLYLEASEDASGVVSHTDYDVLGNSVESWRTAPGTAVKADWRESIVDAFGRTRSESTYLHDGTTATTQTTVTRDHDALGREIGSDDAMAGGQDALSHYDARGSATKQWGEGLVERTEANATRSLYDEYGQLESSLASGESSPTAYIYNIDGTLARQSNPDGSFVEYVYDAAGNKLSETDQDEAVTAYRYDVAGRMVSSTSADGVATTHTFDLAGREVAVAGEGNDDPSTTIYNAVGWTLKSTDADGVESTSDYDKAGRVATSTVAGAITTTDYDGCGRTLSTTDPDGNVLAYGYDGFGRTRRESHETSAGAVKNTVLDYDSLGRVGATTDALTGVERAFTYATAIDPTSTVELRYAGVMTTVVTNAGLQETARVTTAPGVGTISRTVSVRDSSLRETAWSVGAIELGRAFRPSDGKLTSLTAASGTLQFGYDTAGRKSGESGSLALADIAATYTYTSAGRLESDTASGTAAYVFDPSGNIATETVGAVVRDYDYDAGNRLESLTVGADTTAFGWDSDHGWRTSARASGETSVTYSYTGTGRLARYSDPNRSVEASYTYDAAGQRVSSIVTSGSVTTATRYLYEGLSLLSLSATETAGATETTYSVTYLYDGSGTPYAGIYASGETTTVPFAITTTDRGDVVELTDMGGVPFADYRYDAWGMHRTDECTTTSAGTIDAATAERIAEVQPLRYAGYCFDEYSGLYYLSARTYDPATRQFLTKDPAKSDGEQSAYQYCGGDPVGSVDPSGLWTTDLHKSFTKYAADKLGIASWLNRRMQEGSYDADHDIYYMPVSGTGRPFHFNGYGNQYKYDFRTGFWEYLNAIDFSYQASDTRVQNAMWMGRESKAAWARSNTYAWGSWSRRRYRKIAAWYLGIGAHAIQDVYAHGDSWWGKLLSGGDWIIGGHFLEDQNGRKSGEYLDGILSFKDWRRTSAKDKTYSYLASTYYLSAMRTAPE